MKYMREDCPAKGSRREGRITEWGREICLLCGVPRRQERIFYRPNFFKLGTPDDGVRVRWYHP